MNLGMVCLIALVAGWNAAGQQRSVHLSEPYGEANPLLSPDRAYSLFGSDAAHFQVWLEDRRTHQRKMVTRATLQTLTLAWSPDSAAFAVNDRSTSDEEKAWVYEVKTLDRLDLRSLIVAADPGSVRFFAPGQIGPALDAGPETKIAAMSYVHAIRWLDAAHVEVKLVGHTGGVRVRGSIVPGDCFDLRYRIGRDGSVRKLSERVVAIDSGGCLEMERD